MKEIDKKALFRLSVLGQLVSRERLQRGELQQLIRELAQRELRHSRFTPHALGREDHRSMVLRLEARGH